MAKVYDDYEKQNFHDGQILYSLNLIKIEEAVIDTQSEDTEQDRRITTLESGVSSLQTAVGNGGSIDTRISTAVGNAISGLDSQDAAVSGKYVSAVNVGQNGKLQITRGDIPEAVGEMTGAGASTNGKSGIVPAPLAGDQAKYLKGNKTWSSIDAGEVTSGTFDAARIPNLSADKITTGTLGTARIPNLAASKITSGTLDADRIPGLAASKIASGTLDKARIPALWTAVPVVLDSSSWSGTTYTATVSGVLAGSTVIAGPDPDYMDAYNDAGIYCSGQSDGTLTFTADTAPTSSVTVNVLIL